MRGNRREYHEGREVQGAIEEDPKPRYSDDMARWEVEIPTFAETCKLHIHRGQRTCAATSFYAPLYQGDVELR